jgi:hypothetical protein
MQCWGRAAAPSDLRVFTLSMETGEPGRTCIDDDDGGGGGDDDDNGGRDVGVDTANDRRPAAGARSCRAVWGIGRFWVGFEYGRRIASASY